MAYPGAATLLNQLKLRTLEAATSSTGGRLVQVAVPFRAKYISTLLSLSGEATQSVAGALDVLFFPGALGTTAAITAVVITSGASVTTSTQATYSITASTANPQAFFSQGDILAVSGSTLVAYNVTHILQEF